jgi:CRISPR/Cas system CSM-associated protein Csm2 small subunit
MQYQQRKSNKLRFSKYFAIEKTLLETGMSLRKVAEMHEVSKTTVHSIYSKAHERFAKEKARLSEEKL